jgi:hypothetical protein
MPTRVCPHCHVTSRFSHRWSLDHYNEFDPSDFRAPDFTAFAWQCDNCDMPICGVYGPDAEAGEETVWPVTVARKTYPDVPPPIATAASEAHQALAAQAPRASVAMARATLEAAAKDKGITTGNIQDKINQLATRGHISESMKEAAHEIRFAGNEAAHGDILGEPISVEDATEVVELLDAILERVYQEPAKVARVRTSREARRNAQAL